MKERGVEDSRGLTLLSPSPNLLAPDGEEACTVEVNRNHAETKCDAIRYDIRQKSLTWTVVRCVYGSVSVNDNHHPSTVQLCTSLYVHHPATAAYTRSYSLQDVIVARLHHSTALMT